MENKYYVPSINEIYPSYELEILGGINSKMGIFASNTWVKCKVGIIGESNKIVAITKIPTLLKQNRIRVEYLTKEKVENNNFIFKNSNGLTIWFDTKPDFYKTSKIQDYYGYKDYKTMLAYYPHKQILTIKVDFGGGNEWDNMDTLFEGQCKSENELRKIFQFLYINVK